MLLEFIINNAYSYRDEAYFSMEAAKGTKVVNEFPRFNSHRVLKSAVIFGANASGKSNFIKALNIFQAVVIKADNVPLPFPSFAGRDEPISFTILISKEGYVYRYSVTYTEKKITKEKLEIETKDSFKTHFERTDEHYQVLSEEFKFLASKTRADNLFLNTAKTFNDAHSLNVYRWFKEDLLIFGPQMGMNTEIFKNLTNYKLKAEFLTFMRAADISIEDAEVIEQSIELPSNFPPELRQVILGKNADRKLKDVRLRLKHKQFDEKGKRIEDFTLDWLEESEGTQKLLCFALIILLNQNKVILIDEFDDTLHLELAKSLIQIFNSKANSNQFILTSHELSLMDENFKKEQIYFVERREGGVSDLYSAYDFAVETNRRDYSYLKRYLEGAFGALPIIRVDSLEDILEKAGK